MSSKEKSDSMFSKIFFANRSDPVRSAIGGVLSVAVSVFLILAGLGAAGVVGATVYSALSQALGIGYWLIVILFALTAFNLLRSGGSAVSLSFAHLTSSVIFLVSILTLVSLAHPSAGGVVGSTIAGGMIEAFSVYAGAVFLVTTSIISLLVLFDEYADLTQPFTLPAINLPSWSFLQLSTNKGEAALSDNPTKESKKETKNGDIPASNNSQDGAGKKEEPPAQPETKKSAGNDSYNIENFEKTGSKSIASTSPVAADDYTPPPVSLLSEDTGSPEVGDVKARANLIKRTLENFNINVEMDEVSIGPTVTRYALKPAEGVRLSKITNLQNNLELALAAHPVRIEAPIPGKSLVGIEVPNDSKTTVGLAGLIGSERFQEDPSPLLLGLGQGISGKSFFTDLNEMPHLLIGGATGAGKSVTTHVLLNSLLFRNSPENLKLIMVDPKRVELTLYDGIPHLLTPVITSAKKAILALKWAAKEMDRRYDILEENAARDIRSYHDKLPDLKKQAGKDDPDPDPMPYIVIVIDEMADLMQAYPKELESVIVRIAQMSRAVGIHLILSTQRPDVNVITGLIKANIPARIALQVSSQVDSRTILDSKGAEQLLGDGDMLFQPGDMSNPVRIQSAYISEEEVKNVVSHLDKQYEGELKDTVNLSKDDSESKTIFDVAREEEEKEQRDEKYEEALETVIEADKASTSYLQRKLRIGYSRAARIMDELEENGIISEKNGTKARDVLVTREELEAARGNKQKAKNEKGEEKDVESSDDRSDDNETESDSQTAS